MICILFVCMKEIDIQLYWLNHAVHLENLMLSNGSALKIINPGVINLDQGPDFLEASIKIDHTIWVGSIEIHCKTSGWYKHQHHRDHHYQNVILHVVWEHDDFSFNHSSLLVLSSQLNGQSEICKLDEKKMRVKDDNIQTLTLETLAELGLKRMERKANAILVDLKLYQGNWQFICIRKFFYVFGVPLNSEAFQEIIDSIYSFFNRPSLFNEFNLKCLLLGQAGMFLNMNDFEITQFNALKTELQLNQPFIHLIRFRTRPNNFPEKRIEPFIKFIFLYPDIFRNILDANVEDSEWNNSLRKFLGVLQYNKMVINVFVPVLIAYSKYKGMVELRKKAVHWLSLMPPEKNRVTKSVFKKELFFQNAHAVHTQGIIEYVSNQSMD